MCLFMKNRLIFEMLNVNFSSMYFLKFALFWRQITFTLLQYHTITHQQGYPSRVVTS